MSVETVPDPSISDPGDAIVRVTKAGVCGSDMHIYNHGDAFGFHPGCRLGHELVGVVEEVGAEVRSVAPGRKVASPFWISCGECHFCRKGLQTSCVRGGAYGFEPFWHGGGDVQGCQSEFVRVLPLTDVFTTAYHAVTGADIHEGDTVLVVGDGAVGLLACHAAQLRDPKAVVLAGHHDDRLEIGRGLGATHALNTRNGDGLAALLADLTEGHGPEAVIDAVAGADSVKLATETVQAGGTVSWVGMEVFLGPVEVAWDACFMRNLTIRGGVAPVKRYLPEMFSLLEQGRIDPSQVITQDLPLDEGPSGYSMMAERKPGVVKVAVSPGAG